MLLIQCMWVTTVRYEGRYESNDIFHLMMKGVHVLLLVGVGACSNQFTIEGSFWKDVQPQWTKDTPKDLKLEEPRSKSIGAPSVLTTDYSHWAFRQIVFLFCSYQAVIALQYFIREPSSAGDLR